MSIDSIDKILNEQSIDIFVKAYKQWTKRQYNIDGAKQLIELIKLTYLSAKEYDDIRLKKIDAVHHFYDFDSKIHTNVFTKNNFRHFSLTKLLSALSNHRNTLNSIAKEFIKIRDMHICKICGTTDNIQVDHIIPKAKFGVSHPWNLQCLCEKCNKDKSSIILNEFVHMIENAKKQSVKIFSKSNTELIYFRLSLYYETPTVGINDIQSFFKNLIKNKPKIYPEYKDILDFLK